MSTGSPTLNELLASRIPADIMNQLEELATNDMMNIAGFASGCKTGDVDKKVASLVESMTETTSQRRTLIKAVCANHLVLPRPSIELNMDTGMLTVLSGHHILSMINTYWPPGRPVACDVVFVRTGQENGS